MVGGKFGLGTLRGGPVQRGGRSETGASFKKGEASCDAITAADWLGAECKRGWNEALRGVAKHSGMLQKEARLVEEAAAGSNRLLPAPQMRQAWGPVEADGCRGNMQHPPQEGWG